MKDIKLSGGLQLTNNDLTVRFKKLVPDAVAPKIMRDGDAGADLTATSIEETDMYIEYGTGLAVEVPPGHVGYIFPRSSISNYHLSLSNAVGVIDSNYRGAITFRFKKAEDGAYSKYYKVGDRIGQLIIMPIPTIAYEEAEELADSNRGQNGYGSSGK